jgi:adiponectin receptor
MVGDSHDIFDCEGGNSVSLHKGKGKRLWKKVKCQLIGYHSLPGYLRDNEFILGYYRAEWPLKQAFLSIFSVHNETLNVWT